MKTLLISMLLLATPAWADLRNDSPALVSGYLDACGLIMYRGWADRGATGWSAATDDMKLSEREAVPNTLAYHCMGSEQQVRQVRLVLSINQGLDSDKQLAMTADIAARLCKAATGQELSLQAHNAIIFARAHEERSNGYGIMVERSNGANGIYVLRFTVAIAE